MTGTAECSALNNSLYSDTPWSYFSYECKMSAILFFHKWVKTTFRTTYASASFLCKHGFEISELNYFEITGIFCYCKIQPVICGSCNPGHFSVSHQPNFHTKMWFMISSPRTPTVSWAEIWKFSEKVATWHYRCRHNRKDNCIWHNLLCCLLFCRKIWTSKINNHPIWPQNAASGDLGNWNWNWILVIGAT